ncbi:unnamed protein product [Gongylonema pulchrum]|uniref:Protein CNPPD1 n=1 Tax=Gongylonema pulchrum TaxID=637853 RepID=A0A183E260_9BILA|nr:unnamed protein product [Gongylonema pulchrum]
MRVTNNSFFETADPSELYLSALVIAGKYLHDEGQSDFVYNDEWANSARISLKRLNLLELNVLDALQWDIYVNNEEFMRLVEYVETWVAKDSLVKRGFSTYNEMAVLGSNIDFMESCIKPLLSSLVALIVVYLAAVSSLLMAQHMVVLLDNHRKYFHFMLLRCPASVKLVWN